MQNLLENKWSKGIIIYIYCKFRGIYSFLCIHTVYRSLNWSIKGDCFIVCFTKGTCHIHLCMYCVFCLIFISKCDPFRNNSYQRETILKINRYSFTFFENVFRALLTGVGACTMLAIFGFDGGGRRRKKMKSRDSNPRQSLYSVSEAYA